MAPSLRPSEIADFLSSQDPRLASLITIVGPPPLRRAIPTSQRFERLATAILHQQLAGAAAATITQRVVTALGGAITPEVLLATPEGVLRSCGVSGAKEAALRDLALHVDDGRLRLEKASQLDDADVIAQLSAVRGIGRWTAEMFLMGPLGRHDVWPTGDLGVRTGFRLITNKRNDITPKGLESLGDPFRPYRSALAWYCWQAVDVARANGGRLPK